MVTVTATDPALMDNDTVMVTITVTDVNEPPDVTGEVEVTFDENGRHSHTGGDHLHGDGR